MNNKLDKFRELYDDAVAKRGDIDRKIERRYKLYHGTDEVRDMRNGGISKRKAPCYKNLCYELIEAQINNAIPYPKVTPRDAEDIDLAQDVEGYLRNEMDRIHFEAINDEAERETYIQGTCFYLVGWDSLANTPITQGELFVKMYPLEQVYPQPGIKELEDAEYIFVKELVSKKKLKKLYGVDVEEDGRYKGMAKLITCYYINDAGYCSRYAWVEDKEVFDQEAYELRQFRRCKKCGEKVPQEEVCPLCGDTHFEYRPEEYEELTDDVVKYNFDTGEQELLAKRGSSIPYYSVRQLPFVIRRNVSDPKSLYGVSDVDILENDQEALNKLFTKMTDNVLKAGSFITVPDKTKVDFNDDTLKVVPIKDPRFAQYFSVQTVQANMQQDEILSQRMYDNGRIALGITDSFQGKRDTTAESGKAKEVAAAQSAGRLESKKRMKDAAYGDLYELMFKFLLAYCDEQRTYPRVTPTGQYVEGKFYRYNYLKGEPNAIYYDDRFLFSVDAASVLSNNREALWQETTANFQAGTFGNPADPATLMLFWQLMSSLGYPLAKTVLKGMQERAEQTQIPPELQQALAANPDILQAATQLATGDAQIEPKIKKESNK